MPIENSYLREGNNLLVSCLSKSFNIDEIKDLPKFTLSAREMCDAELIAVGAMTPLKGFMNSDELQNVLFKKHLRENIPWTIPITLSVSDEEANNSEKKAQLIFQNEVVGIIDIEEKYRYPKEEEAYQTYGTKDSRHPGVAATLLRKDVLIAGKITLFKKPIHEKMPKPCLEPYETRAFFQSKGWKTIVGFQTRNPIHRAHEYLIKTVMEVNDGVFIHPLAGETKEDDIPMNIRFQCYQAILDNYFPKERILFSAFPCWMRYGGPREAVFHAILRRNYGCTHFIIGRDHAGVGNFYEPFAAHKIFSEFTPEELGIIPIFFDQVFYCRKCENLSTIRTCPHDKVEHELFSGTQIRAYLREGKKIPETFSRKEVIQILTDFYQGNTILGTN